MHLLAQSTRRLLRRPTLAVPAILVFALAIGANTAIFSLLDTVALRPLPYREADRLVSLGAAVPGLKAVRPVSWPKFQALAAQSRTSAAVAAYYPASFALSERDRPRMLDGVRVSESFFAVFGVAPLAGRAFTAEEQKPGGPRAALLAEGFWRERFGGDPAVLGRSLAIDGVPTTVVGVLPDLLRFPFGDVQLWLPRPDEVSFMSRRALEMGAGYLQIVARLAPGVALAAAQPDADRISAAYRQEFPGHLDTSYPLRAEPWNELLVGTTRTTLVALFAAVGLVLLIGCADVANLLLADGLARRREIATRIALGAARRSIIGQALRESALLAGAGGVLGVALAFLGLRALVALHPADLPRIGEVALSLRALVFGCAATALAALLAGLLPAWTTLRAEPRDFLGESERGAAGSRRTSWSQGLLVSGQVALALVLFSAAGLLLRSLGRVQAIDLGFAPRDLLAVQVTLPAARYPSVEARRVFFGDLLDRVRTLPGIAAAALVEYPPTAGAPHTKLAIEGQPPLPADQQPLIMRLTASSGAFRTLGTRLVAGRDFDPRPAPGAPLEAIASRSLATRFFPGESAIGHRVRLRGGANPLEIVGVVEDIQQAPLEASREPLLYLSEHQIGADLSLANALYLVLRTTLPAETLAASLRRTVGALDPSEPLPEVTSIDALIATGTAQRRLTTGLFSALSGLALLLCVLGIAGVVTQLVVLRRREIGIRLALGATRGRVVASLIGIGARWILPGLALGAVGALVAGRAMESQLFEIAAADWRHVVAAAALLGAVAFLACLLPARAAAAVDPASTLRG